jgi:hypothetical protein
MKTAFFALVLLTGGAAIAQTETTPPAYETTAPAATMAPAGGQTVLPSNAAPKHDARGIAVISDPAIVPPGYNGTPSTMTGVGGPLVETTDAGATASSATTPDATYPACSRTVTDNCLQTYERGRQPT